MWLSSLGGPVARLADAVAGELLNRGLRAVSGKSWEQALWDACIGALRRAVRSAALVQEDGEWLDEVAADLAGALADPVLIRSLVRASLGETRDAEQSWQMQLRAALAAQHDLEWLGQTVDVDQVVDMFGPALWDELGWEASKPDSPLAALYAHAMWRQILGRLDGQRVPRLAPQELRARLTVFVGQVQEQGRRSPHWYPAHFELEAFHQPVRVRTGLLKSAGAGTMPGASGRAYLPKGTEDSQASQEVVRWETLRDRSEHYVVLGEPGYGKTWLLRREAHHIATIQLDKLSADGDPDQVVLPVWVRLDELADALDNGGDERWDRVTSALLRVLRDRHRLSPGITEWIGACIASGRCVLLLDGLDEVAEKARIALYRHLAEWTRHCPHSRSIVTSRLAGYRGPPQGGGRVSEIELVPFSPAETQSFVAAWFGSSAAAGSLLDQLKRNPAAAGLSQVPLLLTLLCVLATDTADPLPTRRAELYERVLTRFLSRVHRLPGQRPTDLTISDTLEILQHIALSFADRDEGWVDLMPVQVIVAAIRNCGHPYQELIQSGRKPVELLATLSGEDGILIPAGDPTKSLVPYLFLHRTFHEYLTARRLVELSGREREAIVEAHRWFDADWEEVIALLPGLLDTLISYCTHSSTSTTIPSTPR